MNICDKCGSLMNFDPYFKSDVCCGCGNMVKVRDRTMIEVKASGKRTNADRIKSMDSAELAGFLLGIFECGLITGQEISWGDCDDCEFKFCSNGENEYKKWLESEVKDGND